MRTTATTFAAALMATAMGTAAAADTKLVFWSMWNEQEPQAQALREIMDAYSAANPDVSFDVAWNGRQNQVKMRAALQAGTQIDFMDQDGDQLAGGLVAAGLGLSLNDMLSDELKASFLPSILDLYKKEGDYIQLPYVYNPVSFWYNKGMFEDFGLSAPTTLKELIKACEVADENDVNLLVTEGNVADYQLFHFSYILQRISGPGALRAIIADKTGDAWRSDAVRQALAAEAEMWDANCFSKDVRGFQYPTGQQTIAFDEAAGELVGAWLPAELSTVVGDDFEWGSFAFPTVEGGVGSASDLQASLLTFMVLKDAPNAAAAVDFLAYAVSKEAQEIMATTGKVGVTRNDVPWGDAIADGFALAANASMIMSINDASNVFFPEYHTNILAPTHASFFLGEIEADEFMDVMASKSAAFWAN